MYKDPKVLATICARGGSKGIKGKNVYRINGRPLIEYTIDCAIRCSSIDQFIVTTDSKEIADLVRGLGVDVPFNRPAEYSTDVSPKIDAILHATRYVENNDGFFPDVVVDLDVTVPQRQPEDIGGVIKLLHGNREFDAAVTVYIPELNPYYTMVEFIDNDPEKKEQISLSKETAHGVISRQDAPKSYGVSGSVFAYRRSSMDKVSHLHTGKWGGYIVPRQRAIEADDLFNMEIIELMLQGKINSVYSEYLSDNE